MEARACFRLGSQVRAGCNIGVAARIHRSFGYRLGLPSDHSAESNEIDSGSPDSFAAKTLPAIGQGQMRLVADGRLLDDLLSDGLALSTQQRVQITVA